VIPKLEELQKEGEAGMAKINQYTRYLTVALAAAQATGYAFLFKREGVLAANSGRLVLIVVTLVAGTTLLMWMGELITKRGSATDLAADLRLDPRHGSGGRGRLVQRRPDGEAVLPARRDRDRRRVVFVQEGQRRIPIQYAKQMVGRRMTSGGSTYMPCA
jgi:preprotein translocase subunit SecY